VVLGAPRLKIVVVAVLPALILAAAFGPLTRLPLVILLALTAGTILGASSARSSPRRSPA
jgi:hypothetical protein